MLKQVIHHNNFFSISTGDNPFEPSGITPLDPHKYSLKITIDQQMHTVYWSNNRSEPDAISNIEKVVRDISSR
jgi:hypothetical protein